MDFLHLSTTGQCEDPVSQLLVHGAHGFWAVPLYTSSIRHLRILMNPYDMFMHSQFLESTALFSIPSALSNSYHTAARAQFVTKTFHIRLFLRIHSSLLGTRNAPLLSHYNNVTSSRFTFLHGSDNTPMLQYTHFHCN